MKNVLLLSVGRRVELAQIFLREVKKRDSNARVFAVDLDPDHSAVCQIVDRAYAAPRVTDLRYLEFVLGLCIENDIGLVVPTIDTELLVLAESREMFDAIGVILVISSLSFVRHCRDKRLTIDVFNALDIDSPPDHMKEINCSSRASPNPMMGVVALVRRR